MLHRGEVPRKTVEATLKAAYSQQFLIEKQYTVFHQKVK